MTPDGQWRPDREEIARAAYEADPFYQDGETLEGFQVSPGGYLSWEQAKDWDAEFGDDPMFLPLTKTAYEIADRVLALPTTNQWRDIASARIEALEAALRRLGSMEAFTLARTIDKDSDAELLARIDFARDVLGGAP